MKVTVTQRDIDRARAVKNGLKCARCPIAFAMRRVVKNKVLVYNTFCEIFKSGRKPRIKTLPPHVRDWTLYFDWGRDVKPIEFSL
jgi:hypothetical protein